NRPDGDPVGERGPGTSQPPPQGGTDLDGTGRARMDRGPLDRSQGARSSFVGRAVARDEGTEGPEDSLVPRVELPRGGGALRGSGERFAANASRGTGTLARRVPRSPARAVPASRGLSHDSGGGNGPCGLGFELSVPEISRRTDRGLPLYGDGRKRETDTL